MLELLSGKIAFISLMAIPFLLAVTLHEAGHAFMANWLGDPTPKTTGRLSLNPLTHIDPFGTIVIPLIAVLAGIPFLIGYAKPVRIDPRYFGKLKRDMILVSLAGPLGNLVVAIFCAYVARFALGFGMPQESWVVQSAILGIWLNAIFLVFNLLPIPPLDGSKIVATMLPYSAAVAYERVAPFGFMILMGLIIIASEVIIVPALFTASIVANLVGVPL